MLLLVTTTQAFFALDPDRRELFEIDRGRGVYYGIALAPGRVYVAARRCPYGVKLPERAAQRGVIIEYDAQLNELRQLEPPFPLRDLHQIHYGLGRLWACCSHDDMLATWDGQTWGRWHPAGVPEPVETPHGLSTDLHHFNSVCSDGRTLDVLANKQGSGTAHRFRAADLAPTGRVELGRGAHNVWSEGGHLHTLSSKDGRLVSTGGLDVPFGGFVRGVVCPPRETGLDRFVGVSSRAPREERGTSDSVLVRCDADWRAVERLPIVGEGMIHDLRAPGVPDLGHPEHAGEPLGRGGLAARFPARPLPGPEPARGAPPGVDLHRA